MDERICLTVTEAAEVLGISKPTMLKLTRISSFPCFRLGRKILIPRQELERWTATQAREGAAFTV